VRGFLKLSGSVKTLRTLVKASRDRLFTHGAPGRGERVTLLLPPVLAVIYRSHLGCRGVERAQAGTQTPFRKASRLAEADCPHSPSCRQDVFSETQRVRGTIPPGLFTSGRTYDAPVMCRRQMESVTASTE
jgi:hypothetical protein